MASGPGAVSDDPDRVQHSVTRSTSTSISNSSRGDATSADASSPSTTTSFTSLRPASTRSQSTAAAAADIASERAHRMETRSSPASVARRLRAKAAATTPRESTQSTTNQDLGGASDTAGVTTGPNDVADTSFTFAFPSMSSNQPDDLFGEQLGEYAARALVPTDEPMTSNRSDALSHAAISVDCESAGDQRDQPRHAQAAATATERARSLSPASLPGALPPTFIQQPPLDAARSVSQGTFAATVAAIPSTTKRPAPLATTPAQSLSWNDILLVQNMIERCLQQYLSKTEIFTVLKDQAQVDPEFTHVVWQKLQEQNPSFFRAYDVLLELKEQILAFNYVVAQQKEMMQTGQRVALLAGVALPSLLQSDAHMCLRDAADAESKRPSSTAQLQAQALPTDAFGAGSMGASNNAPSTSDTLLPSPLPLPSPIKTDLDTHAFFT